MENKRFLTANDVAQYMGISVPMAYKIIRRLNDELVAAGYIIVMIDIYIECGELFQDRMTYIAHYKTPP